ncbi:MAG: NADH-quinone oxidoreductase subunit L [Acidobacteria bacterium]|nr:NADH-quinone oxidoreductase subunit L [Acidobacteriota bacterium]MCH8985083.1 NADH-quinone oxidoreductase subunit L [Acidobacteriota bacterium]
MPALQALAAYAAPLILATEEHGGGEALQYGNGGLLASAAWLIPVVPLVAAFAIAFFGKRLPHKGWELAMGAMGFVGLYGIILVVMSLNQGITFEGAISIGEFGPVDIEWGWVVDGLSTMMYFVVGVVGSLVFIYAKSYMDDDIRYTWFFASFTLFVGGMLVLVSAPNLIQLIVGWELVGVASYLLIGHYWEDHANSSAAIKAFLVNKVADVGLILGAIIIGMSAGSFRFSDILAQVSSGDNDVLKKFAFLGGLALFIAAMGKSAQFPLHVWLPDAMAGPTPVSALMHAATMVTAGIYLIARLFPLYFVEGFAVDVRPIIMIVGALTLFLTGLIALVQTDLKKVLAYSTLSQLGYMIAAMGAGAYTAALFHLFTHAFFKALLFLAAGSVIHSVHSNEMTDMGGLRKYMPTTFKTFVIGSIALAGIFPLAGFWSKDEILVSLGEASGAAANFALYLAIGGAFITAFYMTRAIYLTFYGEYKGAGHPHESPRMMTTPLVVLAGFAIVVGLINIPGSTSVFTRLTAARFTLMGDIHATEINFSMAALGLAAGLGGILLGYRLWSKDADTQEARDTFRIPVLYPLLEHKYYIDDLYMDGIIRPIRGPIARAVDWFNGHVIDLVVNGAGFLAMYVGKYVYKFDQSGLDGAILASAAATGGGGDVLRRLQSGRVQQYAVLIFAGTVVLVAGFIVF